MKPNWRKPAGALLIVAIIIGWAALIGSLSGPLGALPWPAQLLIYSVAGLVWIMPLKPLLRWMEDGSAS